MKSSDMNTIENTIAKINESRADLPFDFAFLGGSILSLLITDDTVDTIRVTKDVDIIVDVKTRRDFHAVERLLEKLGFKHDTREGAPVCRWIYDDTTIDILPIREDVLGWKSKWFGEALQTAQVRPCGGGLAKIISSPYFVALKLEAFEERGEGNFLYSTDFEDVICLFNGRETIADEIGCDAPLAKLLGSKFKVYLDSPELEDAIDGFVQTEINPSERKVAIISRMKMVAAFAEAMPVS